jgi:non-heme chloroperoxidase
MLIDGLGLRRLHLIGHSMGGGEVVRYLHRYGSAKVAKVVLIAAVCPLMLKTKGNPEGVPIETLDEMRDRVTADRAQFFQDFTLKFYGHNGAGAKASQGVRDAFWRQAMKTSLPACHNCIEVFSETDFTEDLKKIDVPTLLLHGEDDEVVPPASSRRSLALIPGAVLKTYPGLSHGMCSTHKDTINADLLTFLQA